ncbi:MAG: hypothetical protein NZ602_10085 [Thermoguttaceae bacterium]|nr:hypothetical protein [Thermoguttaceae bacterium]
MATISPTVHQRLIELEKTSPKKAKWLQKKLPQLAPLLSQDSFDNLVTALLDEETSAHENALFRSVIKAILQVRKFTRVVRRANQQLKKKLLEEKKKLLQEFRTSSSPEADSPAQQTEVNNILPDSDNRSST